MNLCTNAAHAMDEHGGTLTVELENVTQPGEGIPIVENTGAGEFVKLSVSDTGPGIASDKLERIFEPYYTTKEVGKGSGMGLAVVHGIMHSHGGMVNVESKIGVGTIFHVYFPCSQREESEEKKENHTTLPVGTERILLVDDEPMLTEIGKKFLTGLGYRVLAVTSSSEALNIFKEDPGKFDLVITDQTMPVLSGTELAKELLKIRGNLPIILCTGYSSKVDKVKAESIGIREFAMKPLAKKEIAALIRKTLEAS